MLRNTEVAWGAVAKFLHWSIAALIFAQFALGWMAVSWRLSPTKLELFIWHKSIGLLVFALVVLRLLWRFANPVPMLPAATPRAERAAAHASHYAMYALMLALPLSGWVINSAANIPLRVFGWFPLPALTAPDKALAETAKLVHFVLFVLLAALLLLHIAAALRHHYFKRTNVLSRMMPAWRTKP